MLITPIDKNKSTNGIKANYYGVTLIITRAGNTKFKHLFRSLIAPHKYQMDNNQSIPEEISEDIMLQCYSQTILVGWKGLKDAEGKEIPYSHAKAYELLKDDDDAYDFVKSQSNSLDSFITKGEDDTKGK